VSETPHPSLVGRTVQENKDLKRQVRDLRELAMSAEASELLGGTPLTAGFKLVKAIFKFRDF